MFHDGTICALILMCASQRFGKFHRGTLAIQFVIVDPGVSCVILPCKGSACGSWDLILVGSPSIGKVPPWNFGSTYLSVVRDAGVPLWKSAVQEFGMRCLSLDLVGSPTIGKFHRGTLSHTSCGLLNATGG